MLCRSWGEAGVRCLSLSAHVPPPPSARDSSPFTPNARCTHPGVEGGREGSFRATFEDKPLLSDIVFLRAWVGVPLPQLANPVTDLLAAAPVAPVTPGDAGDAGDGAAGGAFEGEGAEAAGEGFAPAAVWAGARPGWVFKRGASGQGYYLDAGPAAAAAAAATAASGARRGATAAAAGAGAAAGSGAEGGGSGAEPGGGWVGMRTTAQLRRALGVAPPREGDSLYRPIERGARRFNPLRVPAALQAELPFKSKPKLVRAPGFMV